MSRSCTKQRCRGSQRGYINSRYGGQRREGAGAVQVERARQRRHVIMKRRASEKRTYAIVYVRAPQEPAPQRVHTGAASHNAVFGALQRHQQAVECLAR